MDALFWLEPMGESTKALESRLEDAEAVTRTDATVTTMVNDGR